MMFKEKTDSSLVVHAAIAKEVGMKYRIEGYRDESSCEEDGRARYKPVAERN
jgi:hypothetical protein